MRPRDPSDNRLPWRRSILFPLATVAVMFGAANHWRSPWGAILVGELVAIVWRPR